MSAQGEHCPPPPRQNDPVGGGMPESGAALQRHLETRLDASAAWKANSAFALLMHTAAKLIGVCNMTALRMLRRGEIKGRQACAGAPWVIKAEDLAGFASGKRRKLR